MKSHYSKADRREESFLYFCSAILLFITLEFCNLNIQQIFKESVKDNQVWQNRPEIILMIC